MTWDKLEYHGVHLRENNADYLLIDWYGRISVFANLLAGGGFEVTAKREKGVTQ